MKSAQLLSILLLLTLSISCRKDASEELPIRGSVDIHFAPMVDDLPMDFVTMYQNSSGEDYTIKSFRFYIHKIKFLKTGGQLPITAEQNHYLIDAQAPPSQSIRIKVPEGEYNGIGFTIGVDSIFNVSGAQDGSLDPAKGMFWTWSTGYIMAKFEGSSPVSNQPGNRFEYHIGGFKGADNVVKEIQVPFPGGTTLQVREGQTGTVNLKADANKWFNGKSVIKIAEHPVAMTPGVLSQAFAENYYRMFSVTGVENN